MLLLLLCLHLYWILIIFIIKARNHLTSIPTLLSIRWLGYMKHRDVEQEPDKGYLDGQWQAQLPETPFFDQQHFFGWVLVVCFKVIHQYGLWDAKHKWLRVVHFFEFLLLFHLDALRRRLLINWLVMYLFILRLSSLLMFSENRCCLFKPVWSRSISVVFERWCLIFIMNVIHFQNGFKVWWKIYMFQFRSGLFAI